MNYYERHLGDYAKDTAHLSMIEHGAYTLLLDRYYSTEKPIPQDQTYRVARAISKVEKQAVDVVLGEFFTLTNGSHTKGRVEEEITKVQTKIKAAQENGKRGGRPKKNPEETKEKPTGLLLGSEIETQSKALQSPVTSHQIHSVDKSTDGKPSDFPTARDLIFSNGVPLLIAAAVPEKNARSMLAGLCKQNGDDAVLKAIQDCAVERPVQPVSWLQAALKPKGQGKHSGFQNKNYREGVEADGTFA